MPALDVPLPIRNRRRTWRRVALVAIVIAAAGAVALLAGRGDSLDGGSPRGEPRGTPPAAVEPSTVPRARVPAGARFVSPSGSDADPGTRARPWRTLKRALRSSGPGDTIVLRAGTYGARGTDVVFDRSGAAGAPIRIMGAPGGRLPALHGAVRIEADHVHLSGLLFDGPTGPVLERTSRNPGGEQVVAAILGSDVTISDSVVRDGLWHAGIYVDGGTDIRILRNHIHDNGNRAEPEQENLDHGVYWGRGSGVIADNVIERNLARGIQLYPSAEDVLVTHNTVVANGKAGIQLGEVATGNLIVNNIVAYNAGSGIRSSGLDAGDNRVFNNLLWTNRDGDIGAETDGLQVERNIVANPRLERGRRLCPTAGSPAIDGALAAYSLRAAGGSRAGRPDIGACELGRRERRSR